MRWSTTTRTATSRSSRGSTMAPRSRATAVSRSPLSRTARARTGRCSRWRKSGEGGMAYTPQQRAALVAIRKRNRLMTSTVNSTVAPAYATAVFAANPSNGHTVTVNGTVVTFVTGTPTGAQVKIGADLATTLVSAAAYFAANAITGVGSVAVSGNGLLVLSAK